MTTYTLTVTEDEAVLLGVGLTQISKTPAALFLKLQQQIMAQKVPVQPETPVSTNDSDTSSNDAHTS